MFARCSKYLFIYFKNGRQKTSVSKKSYALGTDKSITCQQLTSTFLPGCLILPQIVAVHVLAEIKFN